MSASPTHRRFPAVSLLLGLGLVASLAALFLLWSGPEAQAADSPRILAGFQTTEQLRLSIAVPSSRSERPLTVELLDAGGKILDSASQSLPAGDATHTSVRLGRIKGNAERITVRCRLGTRTFSSPLGKVLLVRAQETVLSAATEFFTGSTAELACRVQGVRSLTETVPLAADVTVELVSAGGKVYQLFTGRTGTDGRARPRFRVPEVGSGQHTLRVRTRSALGEETLSRTVKVQEPTPKVLLTTDKPLYQPGQTIRLRALALRTFDLTPVARTGLTFEVEDGKGNKVFRKELNTGEHGIASADFTLADEVNMGEYRITAVLGSHRSEKTVAVKKYVLPKFRVELKTEKTFYLPKEKVRGTLQVDYFFGKPVARGAVEIRASTFDVAFREFAALKTTTDGSGRAEFEIPLPDHFVGQPLAGGKALVKLDAKVTDSAEHSESVTRTCPVSDQPIRISFLPESGRLIPGLDNRVFVAALYPDGSPAACAVEIFTGKKAKGKPLARLNIGPTGLGEFRLTPKPEQFQAREWGQLPVEMLGGIQQRWMPTNRFDLFASARDDRGHQATATAELSGDPLGENILLRLDRAIYAAGDTLRVNVQSSSGLPTVYLDVVRSGQTLLTRWLEVKEGKATTTLDLPGELFGTLEVHAYSVLASGEVVRDARVVYVNPASGLKVKATADRDVYLPGGKGIVRFEVTDGTGKPTPAALGVLIVDEAVYALQEIQPGLEKVFFTLQDELLKPAVQADYRPSENLGSLVRREEVPLPKQQAAQALLTAVRPSAPARWMLDPGVERRQRLQQQVALFGMGLFHYGQTHDDVLVKDRRSGRWMFRPDALVKASQAGYFSRDQLADPLGGQLTLERLEKIEPGFTVEKYGVAVTQARLALLAGGLIQLSNTNRAKWFRGGKWHLPEDALAEAARLRRMPAALKDAWGREMKLVRRTGKEKNPTGQPQFHEVTLASAGPDGRLGTADDLEFDGINTWVLASTWYQTGRAGAWPALAWRGKQGQPGLFLGMGLGGVDARGLGAVPGGLAGAAAPPPPPAPAPLEATNAPATDDAVAGPPGAPVDATTAPALRLREFFPETLLWRPALLTDARGRAELEVPFADSITTWRLTASASSPRGLLGGMSAPLRVFQDFFVDLDLPVALTQNDEVAFPVAVYNYLPTPQTVTLELKSGSWFDLVDPAGARRTLKLGKGEVTAVRFRIRARKVGTFPLTVEARGSKMSDAVRRSIEILPDGKAVEQVFTDRLEGNVSHRITLPNTAIDGASRLYVKLYPGVVSQVVEGLEGMLRMPTGCFEQTSSAAYPNILVVDHIRKSRRGSPALLARAEQFLSVGYQRLLTFERPGGGFDWWGSGPPLVWLSAYGLQEFNDMARVWPVDPGVIQRTQAWLLKQQGPDGTWANIGATHGESIERMGDPKLLLTSYVAWSLLDSMPRPANWRKRPEFAPLARAIAYIREHAPKAENAYVLALAANALASWDATDDSTFDVLKRVLGKLDAKKSRKPEWNAAFFTAEGQSLCYGRDDSLTVETTALACLAMLKSGQFTTSVNQALAYLVKTKGAHGHWGSTQATILALKALLRGLGGVEHRGTTPFTLTVNGKPVASGEVTEKNADLLQQFDLTPHLQGGATTVGLEVKGKTALMYQVVARHFEPYRKDDRPARPVLSVDLEYDRAKLSTADLLRATATLRYRGRTPTYNVIVDLPIPPGFTVDAGDFAELVAAKKVQKFSVTARQVILYLGDVKPGSEHRFDYTLKPKYPIRARTQPAVAYEYYTPVNRAVSRGVDLVVE